jgi:hypothetical protein
MDKSVFGVTKKEKKKKRKKRKNQRKGKTQLIDSILTF